MMDASAPIFGPPGALRFRADHAAKRVQLPVGTELLLQRSADSREVRLHSDHGAGRVRYVKDHTLGPVRLLFPVDIDRIADGDEIAATGQATSASLVEWASLLFEGEADDLIYAKPLLEPDVTAKGLEAEFSISLPPRAPPAGTRRCHVVIQLGREAGELRFLTDPTGGVAGDPADVEPVETVDQPNEPQQPNAPIELLAGKSTPELVDLLSDRVRSLGDELRRIEAILDHLRGGAPGAGTAPIGGASLTAIISATDPRLPLLNWVIGPPENAGWAYGNNARRLASRLPQMRHAIASEDAADVALYFDPIVAQRYPATAGRSILRIGGPRPLDRLFGDDENALADGLASFSAVVPLNLELHRRTRGVAGKLRFIPNALDLNEWHPDRRRRETRARFTVGFAASMNSTREAEVKGYAIAKEAADLAGAELLVTQKKAGKTIGHDRMLADFYSKCDVLLHPVAPGREGTSNVIMEALAVGLPVICTTGSGLHGELLTDRANALVADRSVDSFAAAILLLKNDRKMRERLAKGGRAFAERHHDLEIAALRYRQLLRELLADGAARKKRVCFLPFWEPAEQFGSSRLRGVYAAHALDERGATETSLGYDPNADIAVVIQMCDDTMLETLTRSGQFVVYDVCDRYFENQRIFKRPDGDVDSIARYNQLVDRADLVIVPTLELKIEVSMRHPDKAVVHIPEPVDYAPEAGMMADPERRTVLWFGNPDRGNFESARWMLDRLRDQHGYRVKLVSRKSFFRKYPDFDAEIEEWSPEAMKQGFADASLCVVSHAEGEQTKSPNRLIAAVMHGLPTLIHNSTSCEQLLHSADGADAIVGDIAALDAAVERFEQPDLRRAHLSQVQAVLTRMHGHDAVAASYSDVFDRFHFAKAPEPTRIGIVSHNLQIGEGAPRSLFELARALGDQPDIEALTYSAGEGDLEALYAAHDVPITIFDRSLTHCVRALNTRYGDLRQHFRDFLIRNRIEVLICNTVKTAPFAYFAHELGIPSIVIVRESFDPSQRFAALKGEARMAVEVGLTEADQIVFVADESRDAWRDFRFEGKVHVINNGVDPKRFESALAMSKAEARVALGLPDDEFVAICVGSIGTRKGQAPLARAFADLPPEVAVRSRILFIGAAEPRHLTPFRAALDEAEALVGPRLTHVTATEDIGLYYRAADVMLMNSSNEAYPRSVMESMLFGVPVLSTRVFGVMTQVTDDANGLLYDIGDLGAWRHLFARLSQDSALRHRLGQAAYRSFWRHTTTGEMLARYRALIGQMAHAVRAVA